MTLRATAQAAYARVNRRSLAAAAGSAALRGVSILCTLLAVTLIVRLLGPVRYGQYVLITSLAAWLALCTLGTAEGVTQGLVRARRAGSDDDALDLLRSGVFWSAIGGAIGLVAGVAALLMLQPTMSGDTRSLFAGTVLIGATALLTPTTLVSAVFVADGRIAADAFFKMIQPVILVVLVGACFALRDSDAGILLIAACAAGAFALAVARLVAVRICVPRGLFAAAAPRPARRAMLATAAPFFVLQIAAMLAFQTDRFIVNHFASAEQLGSYDLLVRIYAALYSLYSIPLQYIWAGAGGLWAAGEGARIPAHIRPYLLGSVVFWGASLAIVSLAAPTAINLVSGGALPLPGVTLSLMVGVFFLVRGTTDVLTLTLYATGRQARTVPWIIAHGLANVALASAGGLYAGVPGIVAGQIVAFLGSTLVPFYRIVHQPPPAPGAAA